MKNKTYVVVASRALPISLPRTVHPDGVCTGGVVVTTRLTKCKKKTPPLRVCQREGVIVGGGSLNIYKT